MKEKQEIYNNNEVSKNKAVNKNEEEEEEYKPNRKEILNYK